MTLVYLALLLSLLAAHSQQPPEQEEVHLQLTEHVREGAYLTKDLQQGGGDRTRWSGPE